MAIRTLNLYSHIGASGGAYSVVEHFDDVTGFIQSYTVTVPANQSLSYTHQDNVLNWSASHTLNQGTFQTISVPVGQMARSIPIVAHDTRVSYSFQPSD